MRSASDFPAGGTEPTIRFPYCQAAYETLTARGAKFLTPPVD